MVAMKGFEFEQSVLESTCLAGWQEVSNNNFDNSNNNNNDNNDNNNDNNCINESSIVAVIVAS